MVRNWIEHIDLVGKLPYLYYSGLGLYFNFIDNNVINCSVWNFELIIILLEDIFLLLSFSAQRPCEANNPAGEISSFTFAVCVKSIPLNHFKPICSSMSGCQRIFRNSFLKMNLKKIEHFTIESHF